MLLPGLALVVVTRRLSPKEIGRLKRTCRALAAAAEPLHASWAALRADVLKGGSVWHGWHVACLAAAERGDVQAMIWVEAQGVDLESACVSAATGGDVTMLTFLRTRTQNSAWTHLVFSSATFGGHLLAVQWMLDQVPPCPWNCGACEEAARGGHLPVLQLLAEQRSPANGQLARASAPRRRVNCQRCIGCMQTASQWTTSAWVIRPRCMVTSRF